ncbi:MAG: response regulator [Acidobacteriales bacterium]|nr:response regulator [Terriglobales bacterium]
MSILIVDDNAVMRRTLRTFFEQHSDWAVCGEAVDGLDAIQKAQQLEPDIIILDLSMPVMNGFEAARELSRIRPSIPLLMFTSALSPALKQEARAVGCVDVISKSDQQPHHTLLGRINRLRNPGN